MLCITVFRVKFTLFQWNNERIEHWTLDTRGIDIFSPIAAASTTFLAPKNNQRFALMVVFVVFRFDLSELMLFFILSLILFLVINSSLPSLPEVCKHFAFVLSFHVATGKVSG